MKNDTFGKSLGTSVTVSLIKIKVKNPAMLW
jgi:hypothetical protein